MKNKATQTGRGIYHPDFLRGSRRGVISGQWEYFQPFQQTDEMTPFRIKMTTDFLNDR